MNRILFLTLFFTPVSAYAYINPGAGSAVLALILAGLSGVGILWRLFRSKLVKAFIKRKRSDSD